MSRLVLVLDTASPVVSVAIGRVDEGGGHLLTCRDLELKRSSEQLLGTVDAVLADAGVTLDELGGVAAVRGPGSFTGLRVGLATALGLHQARGLPAVGLDALRLLARAAARDGGRGDGDEVVAAVDALRGEWMSRRFRLDKTSGRLEPTALEEPTLRTAADLFALERPVIAFGGDALEAALGNAETSASTRPPLLPAPPLAPLGLDEVASIDWDPGTLVQPIYFRPPATTPPRATSPS
ncbi:MAG: tRNA (adenosine(37)-N6)-threonylcarbamoyltransferase complex dimerization subunit type 1 TsaB [Acidobacteriota bacterium]